MRHKPTASNLSKFDFVMLVRELYLFKNLLLLFCALRLTFRAARMHGEMKETSELNIPLEEPSVRPVPDPLIEPHSLLSAELSRLASEISDLEASHLTRMESAVQQLRQNITAEISAEIHQRLESDFQRELSILRNEMEQRERTAQEQWEQERSALARENEILKAQTSSSSGLAKAIADVEAELATIEHEIQVLLDDPKAPLSSLVHKNARKTELEAYLKGLRFRTQA